MAPGQDKVNSTVGLIDKGKCKANLIYLNWRKSEPKSKPLNQYDKTTY